MWGRVALLRRSDTFLWDQKPSGSRSRGRRGAPPSSSGRLLVEDPNCLVLDEPGPITRPRGPLRRWPTGLRRPLTGGPRLFVSSRHDFFAGSSRRGGRRASIETDATGRAFFPATFRRSICSGQRGDDHLDARTAVLKAGAPRWSKREMGSRPPRELSGRRAERAKKSAEAQPQSLGGCQAQERRDK